MIHPRLPKPLVIVLIALALVSQSALAQTLNKKGKYFPALDIPKNTKGPELPAALGTRLHEIADWYDQTDTEFTDLCKREHSIGADRKGRLHYVCSGGVVANGATSGWGNTGTVYQAPFPDSQTFLLHSKLGATKVIYLDFDGNVTSGTAWNSSYSGGANITTPRYDIDGNPGSFNSTELANIQIIWQSVSEDYAPFDVDVTTQDPGVEALRKTSSGDAYFGIRVCIGGSSQDWLKASAGGVAYLGSFDWNTDTPAFVFPAQLGNGNPKFVAEAVSHEAGHSFGLHHDGQTNGTEYFAGQGNWAPIMGVGYYKDVVQWSKGEYALANNLEDDLAVINARLAYRTDAVGNDAAHAAALSGSSLNASGLVERTGDVDVFTFNTGSGGVTLAARPVAPGGNLNLLLSLYDASGVLVASVGPSADSAGVSLARDLAAGTYYLAVNGVGSGDPATNGFSNYGSLGQFSISGTVVPTGNRVPLAVASNSAPLTGAAPVSVNFSSAGSSDPDGTIAAYRWTFGDGTTSTAANPSHSYSAAGSYAATLVVTDNAGAESAPASVTVVVTEGNQAPVAVASSSSPLSGSAPLAVTFSSAGSYDPDGALASYWWDFGDGTTSSEANPAHTYVAPGTFAARLVVTDNMGVASAPASLSVTAKVSPTLRVAAITMTKTSSKSGTYATATVTVRDQNGALKSGAIVTGTWSGLTASTASGKTNNKGIAAIKSGATTKHGTFTFTVTGITLSGYVYGSAQNSQTAASVSW
jgi:PKD repeat protein